MQRFERKNNAINNLGQIHFGKPAKLSAQTPSYGPHFFKKFDGFIQSRMHLVAKAQKKLLRNVLQIVGNGGHLSRKRFG